MALVLGDFGRVHERERFDWVAPDPLGTSIEPCGLTRFCRFPKAKGPVNVRSSTFVERSGLGGLFAHEGRVT